MSAPMPGTGAAPRGTGGTLDAAAAPAAVAALGCGLVLAAAGGGAADPVLLVGGGALAAAALLILLAGSWIDPTVVLVLSLPLPALVDTDALRLAPAAPATALVVAAWFLAWGPSRRHLPTPALPARGLAAFLGAYVLAGIFTAYPGAAAREIVNLLLLASLLFVMADHAARSPGLPARAAVAVAAVGGVSGALAVLEAVGVLPGRFPEANGLNRAALGFGQPNGLGMFLALCVPLTVHARAAARPGARRVWATLALAGVVAGLAATLSRGSVLSVLAGALVLPLAGGWRTAAKAWAVGLVAAVAADVATGGVVRETVAGAVTDWSVAQRAALMLAGVRLFFESPLVGIGPGAFAHELERAGVLVPTLWDLKPTPHNAYIQVAAEAGILGLAGFALFLGATFRRLLRSARAAGTSAEERSLRLALLWGFAVLLAEGMVEWPLSHGHGQLAVIMIALGCARGASSSEASRHG